MGSRLFFTADTHFNHTNILKYCPDTRAGCKTVEEMNDMIVDSWNARVDKGDVVWHLGDIAFGDPEKAVKYVSALKGTIHLIKGNHDYGKYLSVLGKYFDTIQDYKRIDRKIDGEKYDFALFHYPIKEWDRCHHGTIHLYGHVHQRSDVVKGKAMNVGVDQHPQLAPFSVEEIVVRMKHKECVSHH